MTTQTVTQPIAINANVRFSIPGRSRPAEGWVRSRYANGDLNIRLTTVSRSMSHVRKAPADVTVI